MKMCVNRFTGTWVKGQGSKVMHGDQQNKRGQRPLPSTSTSDLYQTYTISDRVDGPSTSMSGADRFTSRLPRFSQATFSGEKWYRGKVTKPVDDNSWT